MPGPKIMSSLFLVLIYTIIGNCESISSPAYPNFPAPTPSLNPVVPITPSYGPMPGSNSNPAYQVSPVPAEPAPSPSYQTTPATPSYYPGPSLDSYPPIPAPPSQAIPSPVATSYPPEPASPLPNPFAPSYPPKPASPQYPPKPVHGSQTVKAAYWPSFGEFPAFAIDTTYFTHIYYAFLLPEPTTFRLDITPYDQIRIPRFMRVLRTKNPPVKTLLSIGGAGNYSILFSKIASTKQTRAIFINSTIEVARQYGFDGVDLDWEFPENNQDMYNLGLLYRQWRKALAHEARTTGKPRLLLTSAVYYASNFTTYGLTRSYPSHAINAYVDWINPMCYDYHGKWENFTGANSALYDPNSNISTSYGIESWIQAGVSPKKLAMGLPLYGHTWKLQNPNVNGIGALAVGAGPGDGFMGYNQIVEFNRRNNAIINFDGQLVSYYSYAGDIWIGYDDFISIDWKVQFARSMGLRGYFFWALGQDYDWTLSSQAAEAWGRW